MTGGRQALRAEWAWISKEPGSGEDYGVLDASHGPIGVRNLVWKYVAGVPSTALSLDAPGAPPWMTFGAHATPEGPVVSTSVQFPPSPDGLDQFGRPIWPRLFIASWYEEMARCGASYQALMAAINTEPPIELTGSTRESFSLAVVPQRLDGETGLVEAVTALGPKRMAMISGALLDGRRVAITGASALPLPERVRLLDAAVALLPYGFRAEMTASSSVDRKITHEFRLVITDFPDESSQVIVDLRAARLPSLPRGTGREYWQKLIDRGTNSGWDAVIRYLWEARERFSFDRPDQAVDLLEQFHRPLYLWKGIREADSVPLREALAVLHGPESSVADSWRRERERDPETVRKLLMTLLDSPAPEAADALIRNWPVVGEDVVVLVNTDLNGGSLDRARRSLAVTNHAESPQALDWLLKRLLVPVSARKPYDEPIRHRVALLHERPIPAPNMFPATCDALRYDENTDWQAKFVYALLTEEDRSDPTGKRATDWARWLCVSELPREWECPQWVLALGCVVPGAERGSEGSVRAVFYRDPNWIPLIVRLAASSGRLPALLAISGIDMDFIQLALKWRSAGDGDHAPGGELAGRLATALSAPLRRTGLSPGIVACIDITRVLLTGTPRDFPYDGGEDVAEYLAGLGRGLEFLAQLPGDGKRVTRLFLAHLIPADSSLVRDLWPGVEHLIEMWSRDGAQAPLLAQYLADFLDRAGILTDILDERKDRTGGGAGGGLASLLVSRLSADVWSRLMTHERRLEPVGSMKQLETTVKATISQQSAFRPTFRRHSDQQPGLPQGSMSTDPLAIAMYDALYSGISTWGILTVIKTENDRAPWERRITPAALGRALVDFQQLIRRHEPVEGPPPSEAETKKLDAYSELVWLMCLRDIISRNVLGEGFGREFTREKTRALGETRARIKYVEKALPGDQSRRARARFEEWERSLRAEVGNIHPRLVPRSPRQPDAGMRALPAGSLDWQDTNR